MSTIDLKDAYYVIPIAESSKKLLRFLFNGQIYEFTCLPFGLSTAPCVFTKVMKPVVAYLREAGYLSVIYLDDILMIGDTYSKCLTNIRKTTALLQELGFVINWKKSQTSPSTKVKFLGLMLDTRSVVVELPDDKKLKALDCIKKYSLMKRCKIRKFAEFIGYLGFCCKTLKYGWVYMKDFERAKFLALKENNGNFEGYMDITINLKTDFQYWKNNILYSKNPIKSPEFSKEIFSDASTSGWGAYCEGERAHGHWSESEKSLHINFLELTAVFFGLKCFAENLRNCDILLRIDNTTAIAYVNRMGGIQIRKLSKLAKEIWMWCEKRGLWIVASYISSKENTEADYESRRLEPETEFEISTDAFKEIIESFGTPEIDLFATRLNAKCKKYISWFKDPDSIAVDAFTVNWKSLNFYAFPPFSVILRVLQKIRMERATGIVVVPLWSAQPWFPLFMSMCEYKTIYFEPNINLLRSSNRQIHPLWKRITLVAAKLSGKLSNSEEHQKSQ